MSLSNLLVTLFGRSGATSSGAPASRQQALRDNHDRIEGFLRAWAVLTIIVLLCFAAARHTDPESPSAITSGFAMVCRSARLFAGGLMILMAMVAVGGLVGFLFGIPRTLQQDAAPTAAAAGGSRYRQQVNTNLEQISDWLTKILVGVGLTQLGAIPSHLSTLTQYFAPCLDKSFCFTLALIVDGLVLGFFSGYLETRLFLATAFSIADRMSDEVDAQVREAHESEKQKDYIGALSTMEKLYQQITPETPKSQKQRIYENLTYYYLYQSETRGYEKAIKYCLEFLAQEERNRSPRIWINLVCAYAQQFAAEKEAKAPAETLESTKTKALEAARTCLQIEPTMIHMLRMLWNPNDPTKISDQEDDLEVFFDDPDFRNLLGA